MLHYKKGKTSVKIGDFGYNKFIGKNRKRQEFDQFTSPEILDPLTYTYNPENDKQDVWSLGLILYEMIIGGAAFDVSSKKELLERIRV